MLPLVLLLACTDSTRDDSGTNTGTLPGDGGAPSGGCVEVSRTPVDDTSVATAPLSFAADEALAIAVGSFSGTATLRDADEAEVTVPAAFGVDPPTAVVAVDMEVDDSTWGSDTGPAVGAPSGDVGACPDYYAATTGGTLSTSPEDDDSLWLYEVWGADLLLWEPSRASLSWTRDVADLGGSYRPAFDWEAYDSATLDLSASTSNSGWHGELQWSASRDLGGGMGEGVVGPAGSFDVTRDE